MGKDTRSTKTVLLADPARESREQVSSMLANFGYKVVDAGGGDELLAALRQEDSVDLVVLDCGMLSGDTPELVREIRSIPELGRVPVMALVRAPNIGDVAGYLEMGCDDFLLKPVNPRLLYQRVQALLEANPRAYRRVTCSVVAEATTGKELLTGEIRELGEGGVGLMLDRPLSVGDILKIVFTLPGGSEELMVGTDIIYVQKRDERYLHGLRFIIIDSRTREKIRRFAEDTLPA
ncbi:MAG: response regulator [bacterium]|nr:MAG: response regulator [bacterium]